MENLTIEQLFAFNSFVEFIHDDNKVYRLIGGAGVGKTFLTLKMIQCSLNFYDTDDIIVLCPTHKALHVLEDVYKKTYKNDVKFQTVAKYLLKTIKYNEDGTKYFKTNAKIKCKERLIFIDEISMLSDEEVDCLLDKSAKLVFIGDYAQLEPIGNQGLSKIFDDKKMKESGIKMVHHELKDIIRTKNIEIKELYHKFRKFVDNDDVEIEFSKDWYNGKYENVLFVDSKNKFLKVIKENFTLEKECKIIAYRNERVKEYNSFVRSILFNTHSNELYIVGEKLIFNEPYNDVFNNNDEVIIKSVKKTEMLHPNGNKYKVYDMQTECGENIITLQADSRKDYYTHFENRKKEMAKKKNRSWKLYYKDFYLFNAPCSYSYSITTHKAQGSTIEVCFIDLYDIINTLNFVQKETLEKTMYTAISRASEKLYCFY